MIEIARSAAAFFRDCLDRALRSHRVETTDLAESYLVHLLTDLANPKRRPFGPGESTLVEMLADANAAQGPQRAKLLRELGDVALVGSGVFREQLLHRGMSLSYYESVGGTAYLRAGHLHRAMRASPIDELCLELGAKFASLADALDAASTLGLDNRDVGLVALLGRFERHGSGWIRDELIKRGVDPRGKLN
jgi:hypothetical protein